MSENIRKVLLIGIDGASWNIIQRLRHTEILSMSYIEGNAAHGVLESTIPPWSVPAWNSLFSGVRPEKLGIYSFIKRYGGKLAPVSNELDDQVYLWDLVSMHGRKVIAVNVPCVSKAIPVNGYFVAGFLANRKKLAYPSTLNEKLLRYGYIVDVTDAHPLTDEEYLEACVEMTIQRTTLFLSLAKEVDWSLGIIVYTCSDRIQHRFLKTRFSFVEKYYEVLDRCIAKLLDFVDIGNDTIVFMVSDHGFKIPKAAFSVNTWLASKGYLSINGVSLRRRVKRIINYYISNNYLMLTMLRKLVKTLSILLRKRKDVTHKVHNGVKVVRGAYMPSEDGAIYITGVPGSLRGLLSERIAEELSKYVPEVRVHLAHELSWILGEEEIPDLILESDSLAFSTDPTLPVKLRTMRATHSRHGVFIALGPRKIMNPGFKGTLKVTDVAPTILYCLGVFIPTYVDGHVITALFTEKFVSERKLRYNTMTYNKAKLLAKIHRFKMLMKSRN